MKKKIVLFLLAAVTASMVFAGGCGSKDSGSDGSSAAAETSAEAEDVTYTASELIAASSDYDVSDYVKLNDYMNMTVELDESYEVTDEDIQAYITYLIAYYPVYETSDKTTVESGDIVNIDYVGTLNGEEFDGGSAEGYHLTIGSGKFIDGFEDGLIGANVGDTVELNLTFPEDYSGSAELAGQAVVFTVTVNSIDTQADMTYDTLTDDYVKDNFYASYGLSTVDELKADIQSALESTAYQSKQTDLQEKVMAKLLEECEVTLPDGLVDQRAADYKAYYQGLADAAEQTLDEYLQANYSTTEAELDTQLAEELPDSVKEELILEAIVKELDISITQSDYESFVSNMISNYGFESEDDFYARYGTKEYVMLSYAENQALLQVMDATTTTVAASTDDTATDDTAAE